MVTILKSPSLASKAVLKNLFITYLYRTSNVCLTYKKYACIR